MFETTTETVRDVHNLSGWSFQCVFFQFSTIPGSDWLVDSYLFDGFLPPRYASAVEWNHWSHAVTVRRPQPQYIDHHESPVDSTARGGCWWLRIVIHIIPSSCITFLVTSTILQQDSIMGWRWRCSYWRNRPRSLYQMWRTNSCQSSSCSLQHNHIIQSNICQPILLSIGWYLFFLRWDSLTACSHLLLLAVSCSQAMVNIPCLAMPGTS